MISGAVLLGAGLLHCLAGAVMFGVDAHHLTAPAASNLGIGASLVIIGVILTPVGAARARDAAVEPSTMIAKPAAPRFAPLLGPGAHGGLVLGVSGTL